MGFITTELDFGNRRPGSKITAEFPYTDITIQSMKASCDCTTPVDSYADHLIRITFDVPAIPVHLLAEGYATLPFVKQIIVAYVEGGEVKNIVLKFKGVII